MKLPLGLTIALAMTLSAEARAQQTTTTTTQVTPSAPAPTTTVYVAPPPPPPPPTSVTSTTSAPVDLGGPPAEKTVREEGYAPNTWLLGSGLVLFGATYGTSVIIAASSSHDGDHHLYVPVVGPWIDMANRGSCPVGSNACDNETTNKVLLGIDGVLQAAAVLEVVSAFLSPDRREVVVTKESRPHLVITPERVGTGYGMGVLASF